MELKCLVVLAFLGVAAGFTVPEGSPESKFPSSYLGNAASASATPAPLPEDDSVVRNKRGLLFKKGYKKGGYDYGHETGHVTYETRPGREVHHHHHYSNYPEPQQPTYVERRWESRPSNEYHHYHGGYQGSYASAGSYSGGGYYPRPTYGNGYQPPQEANPNAANNNNVDRGQGAAAVNNIAIIHARAGSTQNAIADELTREPFGIE